MKLLIVFLFFAISLTACNRSGIDHPCYDSSLTGNDICPTDCPGFKGCDGETYCNECEAAREGIGPK